MTITYPPELLPTSEDAEVIAECDCCGQMRALERCWAYGIETFACDECRGA